MHDIELWRWRLMSPETGKRYQTRYRMTEADARLVDPTAERIPGSREVRSVPDGPHEHHHTNPR